MPILAVGLGVLMACADNRSPDEEGTALDVGPPDASVPAPDGQGLPLTRVTVTDFFPATGSRGLVLNNCASCHAVACAAIGQRSATRWAEVEASHVGYVPGLSSEDRGKIFDYVRRNFNDTLPEPPIPLRFLEGGCPSLPLTPASTLR